jgi:hypothetical protein
MSTEQLTPPPSAETFPEQALGNLEPVEVLCEVDIPRIFTTKISGGLLSLAYLADEREDGKILLLAPTSASLVEAIKKGNLPVRDALTRSSLVMVHQNWEDKILGCHLVDPSDIPPLFLPTHGTTLYPEHMPVLTARALGALIKPGAIPASVVSFVAEKTRMAMKVLIDHVLKRSDKNRPPEAVRMLYDLPVNRLAFNSFEIDFGVPRELFERKELVAAADLLRRGLDWASASGDADLEGSDEERAAIREALALLSPPAVGAIEEMQIGGTWAKSVPTRLTRAVSKRVSNRRKGARFPRNVALFGKLYASNTNDLSCMMAVELRDENRVEGLSVRLLFEPEHYERAGFASVRGEKVVVVGIERSDGVRVDAMRVLEDEPDVEDSGPDSAPF